jgi:hypothetical protein
VSLHFNTHANSTGSAPVLNLSSMHFDVSCS